MALVNVAAESARGVGASEERLHRTGPHILIIR
jgi:hypothetical protein